MKRILTLLALSFALALTATAQLRQDFQDIDVNQLRKLQMVHVAVTELYVDTVNQGKLTEAGIRGILNSLDPHSSYSDAKETKAINEPLQGNFEGIGVQFNMLEDTLVVIQTIRKGPSEKVGILAGDRIVKVNEQVIAGVKMERDSIMRVLRGPKGTVVKLGIIRRGVPDMIWFNVTRDKIPMNTLDAAYIIRPGVGYIHLDRFGATSGAEVKEAIEKLKGQGMKDLILDLESNGGGYLGAAVEVANQFLNAGDLIVYTEGRATPKEQLKAEGGGLFRKGKLIVLVDEFTASAAEIVSGAVQDYDRGTIVGRRTFGKGLVQRPIPLLDGSMIRLTVAHYYTPSGRCIQKPYTKGRKSEYEEDFENRFKHGELISIDSIRLDSTKVYHTLNKRRPVYGGGGIMPDVFVPLDTTTYTKYYMALRRGNYINDQSLRYIDRHRADLKAKYKDIKAFIKNYEVPTELTDTIVAVAGRKGVKPKDDAELQKTLKDLRFTLKSLIIYDIWDRNEYFQFINSRSDIVKKALEILGTS
ncbi:S41 family peptidase [Alloprevotella tannerae]|uniref:S41 family peptidase n=1 Tax=Alloprevotella tannerae TaxID=76122 RepID=UPI001EDC6A5E|nr:S41 family peptidase [Alloprevotella tannerae]MCG2653118.1 S41 family peptidase [Alloprevotella tannerae]